MYYVLSTYAGRRVPTSRSLLTAHCLPLTAYRATAGRRLYLRHYWDLEPLCRRFDIVPYALYARHYARQRPPHRRGHRRQEKAVVRPREPPTPAQFEPPATPTPQACRANPASLPCQPRKPAAPTLPTGAARDGIGLFRLRSERAVRQVLRVPWLYFITVPRRCRAQEGLRCSACSPWLYLLWIAGRVCYAPRTVLPLPRAARVHLCFSARVY